MHTSMNVPRIRVLLLVIGVMGLVNCKRMKPAAVTYNKVISAFNPRNLEFLNAFVSPGSNGQMFELNAMLKADISSGLRSRIEILVMTEAGYNKIFAYDLDLCQFWEGSVSLPLVKTWLKNVMKYSNFPNSCPVKSGYYYIKSLKLEKRSVPLFLMEGQYMVKTALYIKNEQNMVANVTSLVGISK